MIKLSPIFKKLKKRVIDFPSRTLYLAFISLILLSFVLAFLIFYLYVWKGPAPEISETKESRLNIELYQKVKEGLDQREKNIEEAPQKQLADPFR